MLYVVPVQVIISYGVDMVIVVVLMAVGTVKVVLYR